MSAVDSWSQPAHVESGIARERGERFVVVIAVREPPHYDRAVTEFACELPHVMRANVGGNRYGSLIRNADWRQGWNHYRPRRSDYQRSFTFHVVASDDKTSVGRSVVGEYVWRDAWVDH